MGGRCPTIQRSPGRPQRAMANLCQEFDCSKQKVEQGPHGWHREEFAVPGLDPSFSLSLSLAVSLSRFLPLPLPLSLPLSLSLCSRFFSLLCDVTTGHLAVKKECLFLLPLPAGCCQRAIDILRDKVEQSPIADQQPSEEDFDRGGRRRGVRKIEFLLSVQNSLFNTASGTSRGIQRSFPSVSARLAPRTPAV